MDVSSKVEYGDYTIRTLTEMCCADYTKRTFMIMKGVAEFTRYFIYYIMEILLLNQNLEYCNYYNLHSKMLSKVYTLEYIMSI